MYSLLVFCAVRVMFPYISRFSVPPSEWIMPDMPQDVRYKKPSSLANEGLPDCVLNDGY